MLTKLKTLYTKDKKPKHLVSWADKSYVYTFTGPALFKEPNITKKAIQLSYVPEDATYKSVAEKIKQVTDEGMAFVNLKEDINLYVDHLYASDGNSVFEYKPKVKEYIQVPKVVRPPLIRLYQATAEMFKLDIAKLKVDLCISAGGMLAVRFTDTEADTEAVVCLTSPSLPTDMEWEYEGVNYKATAWDNSTMSYKSVITKKPTKESIMAQKSMDFSELDGKVKADFEATLAKAKEEATQVTAEAKDKMTEILEEAKAKMAKLKASDSQEKEETKSEEAATEPEAQEPTKITRKRTPKTQVCDLQAVIDKVGGTVDTSISVEDALNKTRQLLTAARSLIDIIMAVIDNTEVDAAKLKQLKDDAAKLKQLKSLLG